MHLASAVLVRGGDVEFSWVKNESFGAIVGLLSSLASSSAGASPFSAALDIGSAVFIPISPSHVLAALFCHGRSLEKSAMFQSTIILIKAISKVIGPALFTWNAPVPAETDARLVSLCACFSETISNDSSPYEISQVLLSVLCAADDCAARSFDNQAALSAILSEAASNFCGQFDLLPQPKLSTLLLRHLAGGPRQQF
jgi:hypothetical protein